VIKAFNRSNFCLYTKENSMKRKMKFTLAIVLGVTLLSLILLAGFPVMTQELNRKPIAATGVLTPVSGQIFRITVDGMGGNDTIAFRVRTYMVQGCLEMHPVCRQAVSSSVDYGPYQAPEGGAISLDLKGTGKGVEVFVFSGNPNVRVREQLIDAPTVVRRVDQANLSAAAAKTMGSTADALRYVDVQDTTMTPRAGSSIWLLSNGAYVVIGGGTAEPQPSVIWVHPMAWGYIYVAGCLCPGADPNKDDGCKWDGPEGQRQSCKGDGNCSCEFKDFIIEPDGGQIKGPF
jgi:hypothetical protein